MKHDIDMHEVSDEFAKCWQAAGRHLDSQNHRGELNWLKANLTPPFLEHLSFRACQHFANSSDTSDWKTSFFLFALMMLMGLSAALVILTDSEQLQRVAMVTLAECRCNERVVLGNRLYMDGG